MEDLASKVDRMMQQRAAFNWEGTFREAQEQAATNNKPILERAASLYVLYLFYRYGWGVTPKDEGLALGHLQSSTELGYPDAGMELARHHMQARRYRAAEHSLRMCNGAFMMRDHHEQEGFTEEHRDMLRLLKFIEETRKTEM